MLDTVMSPQEKEDINFIMQNIEKLSAENMTLVKGIAIGLAYKEKKDQATEKPLQQQ